MSLAVAIQMDPVEGINIDADSSFALAEEAQARGHALWHYLPQHLAFAGGRVRAKARRLSVRRKLGDHASLGAFETLDLATVDVTDDTACLAPKVDATLFVVRSEASSMRLTRTALDALHKRQVNVLGLILNAANLRSSEYQYYHKYGDYYADSQQSQNV